MLCDFEGCGTISVIKTTHLDDLYATQPLLPLASSPGRGDVFRRLRHRRFQHDGCDDKALQEGDTVFHSRNQRHAMYNNDTPGLCLSFWRDEFDTPPVLLS
jgi:hypothetical protein